jgi:hypothetical protein|tara:strand:- start:1602 stop:1994 length:393 start_codon:yes stop_codon:yes gene_type:complete
MIIQNGKADQAIKEAVHDFHYWEFVDEQVQQDLAMLLWHELDDSEKWEAMTYQDWCSTMVLKKSGSLLEALSLLAQSAPGEENYEVVKDITRENVTVYLSDQIEERFDDWCADRDFNEPYVNPVWEDLVA